MLTCVSVTTTLASLGRPRATLFMMTLVSEAMIVEVTEAGPVMTTMEEEEDPGNLF
jgi:hypothetical protein